MPGAKKPSVLDVVHRTCKQVVELHQGVSINQQAVQQYAAQLEAAAVRAAGAKGNAFPIKFESLEAEVTFLCLYHLLDFGSGYEQLLQDSSRRGAAETVQYGCFGLALSAKRLDSPWMRAFTPYHVHNAFGIEAKVEEQLQPGITISKPGPLAPLAAAIQSAVVQTGQELEGSGVKSFGAFVLRLLDGLKQAGQPFTAASLVEQLAENFTGFQDEALYSAAAESPPPAAASAAGETAADPAAAAGTETEQQQQQQQQQQQGDAVRVLYLRKAQALAADLAARFGAQDERFRWSDAADLAADSGALLPAILQQLGLIAFSEQLTTLLDQQQQQLAQGSDELVVRAAAVAAVDAVVAAAAAAAAGDAGFTAWDVSSYLLSQVEEQGRQQLFGGVALKPHRTTGTVAY